jgi:hypothetical protein
MTSASGPTRPPAAGPAETEQAVPEAFAKDGAPYSLDDLLSGLEPVLDEMVPADPAPAESWTAETEAVEQDEPPPEPENQQIISPPAVPTVDGTDEWDPSALSLGNIVAALSALADDTPPREAAPPRDEDVPEDVLELGDEHILSEAAPAQPEPVPDEGRPRDEAAAQPPEIAAALAQRVEAIVAEFQPDDDALTPPKGDPVLPGNLDALAVLLADPPPEDDFAALDALYACWPRATQDSESRALLAVAQNLTRNFGLPGKLPMASARAWRMLSPKLFEAELARSLAAIDTFIGEWQSTQRTFLILEFGEVELIEYLFEALHPGYHADLLARVMNFKVLSNRRLGLLRRIPTRMKKQVTDMLPAGKEQALVELAHAKALLEQLSTNGFTPIANTATKALEEIDKLMRAAANAGAPQLPAAPPSGSVPLGRIG